MADEREDEYLTEADIYQPSSASLPSAGFLGGMPTPLSAASHRLPLNSPLLGIGATANTPYPPPYPMTDQPYIPRKGKGKRAAEETPTADPDQTTIPNAVRPGKPQIVRRERHRHRNVAAQVWGKQVLGTPQDASGEPFNVYKALLRHPNLFFQFAIRLSPFVLTELYAIDKEFHYRFNQFSISIIAEHASYHTRDAAFIFSWVLFPDLCISDPMLRPMDGRPHLARDIPSLRWVKMVFYRDAITRAILTDLALEGLRAPAGAKVALMKYWVLMELKTMAARRAFLSDPTVWSDADLLCLLHFAVKLDMRFAHPVFGNGACALSHLLLSQKSLTPLFCVLKGKLELDYEDAEDMLVRTYRPDELDLDAHPWLNDETENGGIPEAEWGVLSHEEWCEDGELLVPALDMVVVEAVRRKLDPQKRLLGWVMYGFTDGEGANVPAPRLDRVGEVVVPRVAWPGEKERESWIAKLDGKVAEMGVEGKEMDGKTEEMDNADEQLGEDETQGDAMDLST